MTHQSVALVGNLLLDLFIDTTIHTVPGKTDGPVHRPPAELRRLLDGIDLGTVGAPASGVTIRAGGAAGNVANMLAERGHRCSLYGAVGSDGYGERYTALIGRPAVCGLIRPHLWDAERTGHSITWYDPSGEAESRFVVSPPTTLPLEIWPALPATDATVVYIDGYALGGYCTGDSLHARDLVPSGASLLLDLAHPYVTDRCADELGRFLARVVTTGREATVFASAAELAPLGGLEVFATSFEQATITLVLKEPPFGATAYRLHRGAAEVLSQYRGEVVRAVETTGLGDAFVAGWIAALLDGRESADELLRRAHASAQACALCVGGVEG